MVIFGHEHGHIIWVICYGQYGIENYNNLNIWESYRLHISGPDLHLAKDQFSFQTRIIGIYY